MPEMELALQTSKVAIMVLKLDGNSERDALIERNLCYLICLRPLISLELRIDNI